ncbi:MAG: hypothetical protein C4527_15425 [Candidatus Omnitrophota bacterium]|jgi:rhamnosyltransferase|nr:MAG: hypothetical protein C4527_15425 [Candidatus Omnitrophota bacterium]
MATPQIDKKPRASVVMCIEEFDWIINQTFAGLFSQSFTDFELILINSGASKHFFEITHQYSCHFLEIQQNLIHSSLIDEKIVQEVRGEIVVLWNARAVPLFSGTLENLIAAFDDKNVMASYAHRIPRPETKTWNRHGIDEPLPKYDSNSSLPSSPLPLIAIRKTLWEKQPLFANKCSANHSDWDEWQVLNGHKIQYIPSALVMYSLDDSQEKMVNGKKTNYGVSTQNSNLVSAG